MDTSQTYIKMSDCPEIQKQRTRDNWQDGDRVIFIGGGKVHIHYTQNDAWADIFPWMKHRIEWLWLPHQDQLQAMIGGFFYYQWNQFWKYLLNRDINVGDLVSDVHNGIEDNPITWEELWLAFVMKENHGKVWENEQWT